MFEDLVQQGVSPVEQAGRAVPQAYLGTIPQLIKDATTTPRGWNVDRAQRRNRRFCGSNE